MGVPKLFDLAKGRLIQNINMLNDVADLPYDFLAPVLRHLQNPDQLMELEKNCPQLAGETGEIWLKFIKRDIPDYQKKPHQPRDPKNWSKVYRKLKKDCEKEEEAQKDALKKQLDALKNSRKGQQTTIVEGRLGGPPSARRLKGFSFGASSAWGSSAPRETGKVAFDKLRRGMFDAKKARPRAAMMPQHVLSQRKATVQQAPARMVRQAEREKVNNPRQTPAVPARTPALPATNGPKITSRPMRPTGPPSPPVQPRARLPEGQQFSAPRLQAPPAVKRKRDEPRLFHEQKRRKP